MFAQRFFGALGIGIGLLFATLHYAGAMDSKSKSPQEEATSLPRDSAEPAESSSQNFASGVVELPATEQDYRLIIQRDKFNRAIASADKKLRNAKSPEEKRVAKEELRNALSKEYNSRLDSYDEYLDRLEAKLLEMRQKLALRRAAEEDMIELRIKVLEAEANDLGWPSQVPNRALDLPAIVETPFDSRELLPKLRRSSNGSN